MKPRLLAVLVAAIGLPVAAQTATPRVDQRQADPEARIQQGAQSGALTDKERARLAREQNRQSRKIAKQKHDKQKKQAPAG